MFYVGETYESYQASIVFQPYFVRTLFQLSMARTVHCNVVVATACEAVVKNFRLGVCERKGLLVSTGSLAGFLVRRLGFLNLCCP